MSDPQLPPYEEVAHALCWDGLKIYGTKDSIAAVQKLLSAPAPPLSQETNFAQCVHALRLQNWDVESNNDLAEAVARCLVALSAHQRPSDARRLSHNTHLQLIDWFVNRAADIRQGIYPHTSAPVILHAYAQEFDVIAAQLRRELI